MHPLACALIQIHAFLDVGRQLAFDRARVQAPFCQRVEVELGFVRGAVGRDGGVVVTPAVIEEVDIVVIGE